MFQESVIGCLKRAELQYPDKVAMIDVDGEFTYRQFADSVYQIANGLAALGIKQGDSVAALCLNHHRFLEITYACHAMGAIINPLNIRLNPIEIGYILTDSKSRVLFIDAPFLPMLEKIRSEAPALEHVYFSDGGDTPGGMTNMSELMKGQPTTFATPEIHEDSIAGYYYTGGTTGMPKGVMLTVRNIMSNAFHLQTMFSGKPEDRWLHIAPMFHLADQGAFYVFTMVGATHVFGRAFDPKLTLELIQKHKVTCTILVPTMLNFVLSHPDFKKYDLTSLRAYLYGASPMPVPLLKRSMEMMPCLPMQGYGMTEAAPLVTALTQEEHKLGASDPKWAWLLGTAGRAVPGVEIMVADEKGNEVPIGTAGEILTRGPNIMKGYLNKPEDTEKAIHSGWYHTGDVAVRNEHGFITIVDRMKDMIISGGENIYTTEVENVLMQFPNILETTVIGVPDDKWGEVVKAFVVMKHGESSNDIEIIEFCRERLAHYKCPKSVDFIESLPKSGAGKILKRELRERYWGAGRQVN